MAEKRVPRIGETGTIFNKLLYAVRKYHLIDKKPKEVAEGITAALKARGIDATISHGYLNKVENGSVRIPNADFITGVTDYYNGACENKWGDVLAFVFDVVNRDLTCNGEGFIDPTNLYQLILDFGDVCCFIGSESKVNPLFAQQLVTTSTATGRRLTVFDGERWEEMLQPLVSKQMSGNPMLDFINKKKQNNKGHINKKPYLDFAEYVIFGRELLVQFFASSPIYITHRPTVDYNRSIMIHYNTAR